jgi:phosphoribosyl 1,2-cyclic phosphate phosphodiesterase
MELTLLGTAASEGWPAPYCDCPHCTEARRRGGANLRSRTGALIDNDFKIDHNDDTIIQMQRVGRSLSAVRTILFTHEHYDHIRGQSLKNIAPPFAATPPQQPIAVYGNARVLEIIRDSCPGDALAHMDLLPINPLVPFTTPTGDQVLPMPAAHIEGALVHRITRHAKSLLYGHDSGIFPAQTFDALATAGPLDIALLECTGGGLNTSNKNHLDVEGVLSVTADLRRLGAITDRTRVIVTHFSHNGGLLHEELVARFAPHHIEVAYDGMIVRI